MFHKALTFCRLPDMKLSSACSKWLYAQQVTIPSSMYQSETLNLAAITRAADPQAEDTAMDDANPPDNSWAEDANEDDPMKLD